MQVVRFDFNALTSNLFSINWVKITDMNTDDKPVTKICSMCVKSNKDVNINCKKTCKNGKYSLHSRYVN